MIEYYVQHLFQVAMYQLQVLLATYGWLVIGGIFALTMTIPIFASPPWRD